MLSGSTRGPPMPSRCAPEQPVALQIAPTARSQPPSSNGALRMATAASSFGPTLRITSHWLAREAFPLIRFFAQQRRKFELGLHSIFLALQAIDDLLKTDAVGPEHRSAAVDWPAVAVDPDHVDIRGALRNALFQDLRALVDHRVERPLDDLLVADLPTFDALSAGEILNDLLHDG